MMHIGRMQRIQSEKILSDLRRKMVFLSGPRQVGKSWLARELAKGFKKPLHLNWDNRQDRVIVLRQTWPVDSDLLIFDEIHKMPEWENYLKGVHDTKQENRGTWRTFSNEEVSPSPSLPRMLRRLDAGTATTSMN